MVAGLGGCQALPGLPESPSGEGLGHDLVAGAAASFCTGALGWLGAEPSREVHLERAAGPVGLRGGGSTSGIELVLREVRDLPLPRLARGEVTAVAEDGDAFLDDPRSRIADPSAVAEATVLAADLAYDLRERTGSPTPEADPAEIAAAARDLPGYVVRRLWVDDYSGFKAFALESRDGTHRIYATAGTQVFVDRDYRDWASGMTMARAQFVSDAALSLARDAADWASGPEHDREVFFTGQSQGAVVAQALGFLTQELLDARPRDPHGLVHVVTWGVTGATEPIVEMIARSRDGQGRDVSPRLELHWSLTDAAHPAAMEVWRELEARWSGLDRGDIAEHVRQVAGRMHVIGYFFDIDPFARVGTFLGTPLVFPVELVLPQRCEPLVTELVFDTRIGDLGVRLESHFLKGYRRAVQRGAVELARPARIEQRRWVLDLLPTAEVMGRVWLDDLYLARLGGDPANWRRCFAAGRWTTDANRDCRRSWWPGCAPDGEGWRPGQDGGAREGGETEGGTGGHGGAAWCLVTGQSADTLAAVGTAR